MFSVDLKSFFKILFYLLSVLTMIFAMTFFAMRIDEIRMDTKKYCPSCGYDLTDRIPHKN